MSVILIWLSFALKDLKSKESKIIFSFFILIALSVALSRVIIGAHWFSDILGSLALIQPISLISDQSSIWIAWFYFVLVTSLVTFGENYAHYIQSLGYVATYRRWEGFVNIIAILAGIIALMKGYGLIGLIFFQQTIFALGLIGDIFVPLAFIGMSSIVWITGILQLRRIFRIWGF